MIRINAETSINCIEHKMDLIDKLKKDEENGWKFPIDSALKIVELLKVFNKVHFLLSELLSLTLDFNDVYECVSAPFFDFYESDFDIVNNSDIKIVKNILNRILIGLQNIDLEEKKKENLFELVFIINKCGCEYNTNGNIFIQKLKSFMDDICLEIVSDFRKIMDFIVEKDKDMYKIIHDSKDVMLLSKICNKLGNNPDSLILDRIKLKGILIRISGNGIFNEIIRISQRLCELKLQICKL